MNPPQATVLKKLNWTVVTVDNYLPGSGQVVGALRLPKPGFSPKADIWGNRREVGGAAGFCSRTTG